MICAQDCDWLHNQPLNRYITAKTCQQHRMKNNFFAMLILHVSIEYLISDAWKFFSPVCVHDYLLGAHFNQLFLIDFLLRTSANELQMTVAPKTSSHIENIAWDFSCPFVILRSSLNLIKKSFPLFLISNFMQRDSRKRVNEFLRKPWRRTFFISSLRKAEHMCQ